MRLILLHRSTGLLVRIPPSLYLWSLDNMELFVLFPTNKRLVIHRIVIRDSQFSDFPTCVGRGRFKIYRVFSPVSPARLSYYCCTEQRYPDLTSCIWVFWFIRWTWPWSEVGLVGPVGHFGTSRLERPLMRMLTLRR